MVTCTDDQLVRTHDEAKAIIRESAGGLDVRFFKTLDASGTPRTRRFVLYHPSHPREPVSEADVYALPFVADTVAARVKSLAKRASEHVNARVLR